MRVNQLQKMISGMVDFAIDNSKNADIFYLNLSDEEANSGFITKNGEKFQIKVKQEINS